MFKNPNFFFLNVQTYCKCNKKIGVLCSDYYCIGLVKPKTIDIK